MYIKASACVCVISITKKNNKKNIFLYLKFAFQIYVKHVITNH